MLLCQFMVIMLSAVKRFDAVALHAWGSAREVVRSLLGFGSDGEADPALNRAAEGSGKQIPRG
jgi:hypothetical protein